jgi:hypothetical protein
MGGARSTPQLGSGAITEDPLIDRHFAAELARPNSVRAIYKSTAQRY